MKKDILVPLVVSFSSLAFLDPFMYLMPSTLVSIMLGVLMIASVVYALMIFKEHARDEREVSIRAFADRYACLVGTMGIICYIVYQVLIERHVSTPIVVILVSMIVTKYVAHVYAEQKL